MAFEEFTGELDKPGGFVAFDGELDPPTKAPGQAPWSDARFEARAAEDLTRPAGAMARSIPAGPKQRAGSVLDDAYMPAPEFDAGEAQRLSRRDYAERTPVPGEVAPARQSMTQGRAPAAISSQTAVGEAIGASGNPGARFLGKTAAGIGAGVGGGLRAAGDALGVDALSRAGAATAKGAEQFERGLGEVGPMEGFGPRSPVPYLANMAEGAASSLGQSAALAATFGAGGVIPAMAVMSAGQEYDKARNAGMDPAAALAGAIPKGAFEAIGEKFSGLDKVAGAMGTLLQRGASDAAKRTASEALVRAGIREIPGEVVTYLGQTGVDLVPGIGLNPNLTMSQFLDGLRDTVVQAAMMGGAVGGGGAAVQRTLPAPMPSAEAMARERGFLRQPTAAQRIEEIDSAGNVDDAIAAAARAVSSPAELPAGMDADVAAIAAAAAPQTQAVDSIARILGVADQPTAGATDGATGDAGSLPAAVGAEQGPVGAAGVAAAGPDPAVEGGSAPADAAGPAAPVGGDLPGPAADGRSDAVAPGMVRLYHGGTAGTLSAGDTRWLTPSRQRAEGYASKAAGGGQVYYVDVPQDSPLLTPAFDDTGTSVKAPPVDFQADADLTAKLQPLSQPATAASPDLASADPGALLLAAQDPASPFQQIAAAELKRRETDAAYAQRDQQQDTEREAIRTEAREQQVGQATATSTAAEMDAPNAMQLAMQRARAKAPLAAPAPEPAASLATAPAPRPDVRIPTSAPEPASAWYGRRGNGYLSEGDASIALPTRQRNEPELDWRIEQTAGGKFRLAGYARQAAPTLALGYDTTPTGKMLAGSDGAVRPETRADVINRQQEQRAAAEAKAQRRADAGLPVLPARDPRLIPLSKRNGTNTPTATAQQAAPAAPAKPAPVAAAVAADAGTKPAAGATAKAAPGLVKDPRLVPLSKRPKNYALDYNLRKGSKVGGSSDIAEMFTKVMKRPAGASESVRFGVVQGKESARLKDATGLDLDGYRHTVDATALRHIFKQHGDAAKELPRGQEAVTAADVARIPEIVANYDEVAVVGKDETGNDLIRYRKTDNGTTFYVEEVRNGRQELTAKSLWKTRTTPRAEPEGRAAQTSETLGSNQPQRATIVPADPKTRDPRLTPKSKRDVSFDRGGVESDSTLDAESERARDLLQAFRQVTNTATAKRRAMTEEVVRTIAPTWKNGPEVVVVDSMQDDAVPKQIRDADAAAKSQGAEGEPRGVYYRGKVYLIASQLADKRVAAETLLHEVLGHHGLRGVFGDSLRPAMRQVAVLHSAAVKAKAREYGLDMSKQGDREMAAEEVLAELAQTRPNLPVVRRAVAAIRTWLRANVPGLGTLKLTRDEIIRSYILPARGWVEKGDRADGERDEDAPMFSRAPATDTEAFRRWFGDSKVVDAEGKPLVVYHGTAGDFSAFSKKMIGSNYGADRKGFFFTLDPDHASGAATDARYAANRRARAATGESDPNAGESIMPVYLSLQNPLILQGPKGEDATFYLDENKESILRKAARARADGIIVNGEGEDRTFVAFRPEQIKSATGNRGTFDPADPDIRFSRSKPENDAPVKPANPWRDSLGRFQFAPGQWLYDKIGDAASPMLVKLGMKAASPELRRQLRQMKLDIEKAKEIAVAVAKEANHLSEAERDMVSDLVEQELAAGTVPPAHAVKLARVINVTMEAQTDELVRLGMLTKDAADTWRGRYLPRYYKSKLTKVVGDVWADALKNLSRRPQAMSGIKGKHLRGRGLYETIKPGELADWEALGWEVRDPTFDPKTSKDVQVWRDFTRAEREKMGEIRDSGFRFVMGYMQTQRDIALGRMYDNMAKDDASSSRVEQQGYVQVPSTKVPGTGAMRYGNLAGRWVPQETMSHLSQMEEAQSDAWTLYRQAMGVWKEGKTVLNPVSHVNNILSNVTMAHLGGVSYGRADKYLAAMKDFATKSEKIAEAKEAGLFLGTLSDAELMNTLPKTLQILANQQETMTAKAGRKTMNLLSFFLRRPMGWAYQAEDTFFRYLLYKEARGRGLDPSDSVDYAQKYIFTYDDLPSGARKVRDFALPFFSYTYKAVPALLHTVLTHPERAVAPAAVMWAINAAAYAIAAGDDDDSWETTLRKYATDPEFRAEARKKEQLEREHLPPWMKGMTAFATPKTIRLGMDEVTKLPLFIDVSRIIPGGDLFDVSPNAGGLPIPQPVTPSHPLFTTAVAMLANKDLFRGRDLVDSNDTRWEATEKRASWLWDQFTPALAVNNYHWERGMSALAQALGGELTYVPDLLGGDSTGVGRDGLPVQGKFAAAQTFGIKVRPLDLDTAESIQENQRRKMIRDIDAEITSLRRLYTKGAISSETLDKKRDAALEKKDRLRQGLTVDGDQRE